MEYDGVKKKSVRDEFAEKFISLLESEKPLQWSQGWSVGISTPHNGVTSQRYHGVNRLVLMFAAAEKGWEDPRFYSFKQVQDKGLTVKAGEHATRVEYWMVWDSVLKKSMTSFTVVCTDTIAASVFARTISAVCRSIPASVICAIVQGAVMRFNILFHSA